jgi:hypothetical protein
MMEELVLNQDVRMMEELVLNQEPTDGPVLCRFVIRPCRFPDARYDVVGNVCHMCSLNYIGKTIHDLQQFLR